jgi:hypothetical protein
MTSLAKLEYIQEMLSAVAFFYLPVDILSLLSGCSLPLTNFSAGAGNDGLRTRPSVSLQPTPAERTCISD